MPLAYRRAPFLGAQWIPPFAKTLTLHQIAQCWEDYADGEPFPAADSIYNIACVAMFPRGRLSAGSDYVALQALSRSYWSTQISQGVVGIYGETKIMIPQGAELVSVSWMAPPAWALSASGPFPEQLFRLQYGLAL